MKKRFYFLIILFALFVFLIKEVEIVVATPELCQPYSGPYCPASDTIPQGQGIYLLYQLPYSTYLVQIYDDLGNLVYSQYDRSINYLTYDLTVFPSRNTVYYLYASYYNTAGGINPPVYVGAYTVYVSSPCSSYWDSTNCGNAKYCTWCPLCGGYYGTSCTYNPNPLKCVDDPNSVLASGLYGGCHGEIVKGFCNVPQNYNQSCDNGCGTIDCIGRCYNPGDCNDPGQTRCSGTTYQMCSLSPITITYTRYGRTRTSITEPRCHWQDSILKESSISGGCSNKVDDDCDTLIDCSDNDCPCPNGQTCSNNQCTLPSVGVTKIVVSNDKPTLTEPITVYCTSTVAGVDSIDASIDGGGMCNFNSWNGNDAVFTCPPDLYKKTTGIKTVRCAVNTNKANKIGNDQTKDIEVVTESCNKYLDAISCGQNGGCKWCTTCDILNPKYYTGISNQCVDKKNSCPPPTPYCLKGTCGATCDLTSGGCTSSETCDLNSCSCVCSLGLKRCLDGSCSASCTTPACIVKADCPSGAECKDGKCGCPFGTTLCGDGTCKSDCGSIPPTCVNNGVCEAGEGCGCVDCGGDADSCLSGNICYPNTDLCGCAFGLMRCTDGSCSASCTTPACTVKADCPSGAECKDGKCGCPFGTTLCGDGTCKADCGGIIPPVCDGDGVCDAGESCSCVDCGGDVDSCLSGNVCYPNTDLCGCAFGLMRCTDGSCSASCTTPACTVNTDCPSGAGCIDGKCGCSGGTDLCGDGTCSGNCPGGDYADCIGVPNGICEAGESCHCGDCGAGQQASCVLSGSCVNQFCDECVLSNARWNVSNCGVVEGSEICVVGNGVDVGLNASGSSACAGHVFDFRITFKDDAGLQASVPGIFADGAVTGSWNSVWKDASFLGFWFGTDPVYGFSVVFSGVSVGSGNFLRVCQNDGDCDSVADGKDQCDSTQYGNGVDSIGCDPEQGKCVSYIDCTDVEWSECNSANQKTRSICKDPKDDPSVCCNYANKDRCACKVEPDPAGNPMPQNCKDNTQLSSWIPTARECFVEKEFPFFSTISIIFVLVILAGYYFFVQTKKRKAKKKK